MNFKFCKKSKMFLVSAIGIAVLPHISYAIGTPNTPSRPEPPTAPGAFQEPFISIPGTNKSAKIETATPEELATPESLKSRPIDPISVTLEPAKGSYAAGYVLFIQNGNNVLIKGSLSGMTPGKHGIHIHQNGDCSGRADNFESAGGHFNPKDDHHGTLQKGHMGDLGNIVVNEKGRARFAIQTSKFTLEPDRFNSIVGRSILIHADADDLKTDPAGKSGKRILCGVIES